MKFTIITAVHNRAATIGQAIDSVAAQTHPDIAHLIMDGASTDGTLAAIQTHRHPRLQIVSAVDNGLYDALNKGMAQADGDIVGLMHSDDFFAHDAVLADVAACFARTGADAVYGDLDYVSASNANRIIRHWRAGSYDRQHFRRGWMPPHPALFVRRHVIETHGGYDTSYQIAADYDAMLRWFWQGHLAAAYLPQVLVKMRVGGASNGSLGRILRKSREDLRALRSNNVGGIGTLACKNLRKVPQFLTGKN